MQYNVLIVGDREVGKTSWIRRLTSGHFDTKVEEYSTMPLEHSSGTVTVKLHELSPGGDLPLVPIQVVLVVVDYQEAIRDPSSTMDGFQAKYGKLPIAFLGNKCDLGHPKPRKLALYIKRKKITFFTVSAKSMYNFHQILDFMTSSLVVL